MIKKMINKKPPRLSSSRPNKNLYFSPLHSNHKNSTRKLKPQTPSSSNIKQSNFSTSNYTNANTNSNNRGVVSSLTDYSQSFMRLASDLIKDNNNTHCNSNHNEKNITTIESLNDLIMTSDNEESNTNINNGKKMISLTKMRKKDGVCKNINLSISVVHNSLLTPGRKINVSRSSNSKQLSPLPQIKLNNEFNVENNKWFNLLLRKSELDEEVDFKLRNYTKIKSIIKKEIDLLLSSQNTAASCNHINKSNHNHIISVDMNQPKLQTQSNIKLINTSSLKPLVLKHTNTPTHINVVFNDHPNYFSERHAPSA